MGAFAFTEIRDEAARLAARMRASGTSRLRTTAMSSAS